MTNLKETAKCKNITLYKWLMQVGEWSGCHQLPERSFFIRGRQFPLCARCTGVAAGYIAGAVLLAGKVYIPLIVCICFAVLMFWDWFLQYIKVLPSTNTRRFITGLLCGIGYLHFLAQMIFKLYIIFKS